MANTLFELDTGGTVRPFVGFGLGIAYSEIHVPFVGVDENELSAARQAMLGVSLAISESTALTLAYRYLDLARPNGRRRYQLGGGTADGQSIELGLQWRF